VEAYSPTGHEENLASLLAQEMRVLGFTVSRDAVGNVIGVIEGGRPRILLCGHMDTVPPELPVKVDDEYICGRGAVDAKAPLTAMIVAASQLHEEGYKGSLVVAGVVDEEGRNVGVKSLISEGVGADYAVFGEPTNVDTVTVGYKGGILVQVSCETETGHSSAPWQFDNAIEKAYEIWKLLRDISFPREDRESMFNSITPCLLGIQGGEKGSVVPSRCVIRVGFRIPPAISVKELQEAVLAKVDAYGAANPSVRVTVETLDSTEPYVVDRKSPLVNAFARAIWKVRGAQAKLINKTGTGDMNHYGPEMGVPVVTYGPGDSHLDHTPHEKVSMRDYMDSVEVLKEALRTIHMKFPCQST
jgi:LysW-gamma-L-lysine carboxypeptidase